MAWIIHNPLRYLRQRPRGEGGNFEQCATLAQVLVTEQGQSPPMPLTKHWIPGAKVKGRPQIPGTVIAIFEHGVYSGKSGKAHTALYVRQSDEGVEVVHQYQGCGAIKGALIRFGGSKLREFSTGDFIVHASDSTVPSLAFANQTLPGHKSGVSRMGGMPEDDADKYYVVERKPGVKPKPNVKQNPEDFAVHISGPTAPNL
jgi:hypothetical protein